MKRKFDVKVSGHRYWAVLMQLGDGRRGLVFWSDHKWPFYHANYFPPKLESEAAWQQFMNFIPKRRTT